MLTPGEEALDRQWSRRWEADHRAYARHLNGIKKLHPPYPSEPNICQECRQPWPCRTWQAVEHPSGEES